MAIKKLFISPGHGNYTDRLDLLEYINQVLKVNSLPVTYTCCSPSTSPTNGQILVFNSTSGMWEATTSAAGGLTNLSLVANATNNVVSNTNGTGFTIPLATSTLAGLMSPAQFAATQSPDGNTYTQMSNGQINFVIDGVTEMTMTPGKLTYPGIIDPVVYAGTPITTAQRNAYPNTAGYLIYNSNTSQYEFNNGTTWSALGGTSTLTNGNILVGNASNVATSVTLSGDVTITNLGVSTVLSASTTQSGKVELATTAETETGTDTVRAITPIAGEATYIKKSLINAKGDLIVGTADNVSTVLSVGTNGQILVADSAQASGLSWTSPTAATRYTQTFLTTDWVVVGNEGTITIPVATHGKGLYPIVRVEEDIAGVFYKVTIEERVNASGDITLKINTPTIAGRIIVM